MQSKSILDQLEMVILNNNQSGFNKLVKKVKGLEVLNLKAETQDKYQNRAIFTSCDVSRLIATNSSSLQEIWITCDADFFTQLYRIINRSMGWDRILTLNLINLRCFHCVIPDGKEDKFASLVERCINLDDCSISHPKRIAAVVLQAFFKKSNMRRLGLTYGTSIDLMALGEFIEHNRIGNNGIKQICFTDCDVIDRKVLNILTHANRLIGIELKNCAVDWNGTETMVPRFNQLPLLGWIIFNSVLCFEVDSFEDWAIGTRDELKEVVDEKRFCIVPEHIGNDDIIVIVNNTKYPSIVHKIMAQSYINDKPGTLIYPLIEHILEL